MSTESTKSSIYTFLRWILFLPLGILGSYFSLLFFMGFMDLVQSWVYAGFIGNLLKIVFSAVVLFGGLGMIAYSIAPRTNKLVVTLVVLVGFAFAAYLSVNSYNGMIQIGKSELSLWGKIKMYLNFGVAILSSIIGVFILMSPSSFTDAHKKHVKRF